LQREKRNAILFTPLPSCHIPLLEEIQAQKDCDNNGVLFRLRTLAVDTFIARYGDSTDTRQPTKALSKSDSIDVVDNMEFLAIAAQCETHAKRIKNSLRQYPQLKIVSPQDPADICQIFQLTMLRPLKPGVRGRKLRIDKGKKPFMLGYMRVIVQDPPCAQCVTDNGRLHVPFNKCVVLNGYFNGACMACKYRRESCLALTPCSLLCEF
jgi:hypothetical protein